MTPAARLISYAQNLEDVLLWRALSEAAGGPGFYIDVGASDPTLLSVTRAFYDAGWHGVNIEPLPEAAAALRAARPRDAVVEAALAGHPGPARPFHRVTVLGQTGLSTLSPEEAAQHAKAGAAVEAIDVPVTTLAEVCRAHVRGPVHFLKIDAEGAEAEILAGADWAAVRPWIVLVEATPPHGEAGDAAPVWEPALLAAGYRHVWSDGLNRFYLADEHAALARHFRLPPNVFDNYVVHDAPLQQRLDDVTGLSERRRGYIAELEAHVEALTRLAAVPAAPAIPPVAQPVLPEPRASLVRRLAWPLYALVRPVARPLAARLRRYLIGPLQRELDIHRHQLDLLLDRPPAILATDPAILAAMEQFMLTLAMQDGGAPASNLLAPPPSEGFQTSFPLANVITRHSGESLP